MATFNELIQSEKPVLVDFFAEWCGPCKVLKPILEELKSKMNDEVRVLKIDVDKNQALANQYQVRGVPTLMIFKEGALKWRASGVHTAVQLEQLLKQHV